VGNGKVGLTLTPYVSLLGEDGDPDLLPTDARDAALDLLDGLARRGYAIVREGRS
jgi:hypothetical protein